MLGPADPCRGDYLDSAVRMGFWYGYHATMLTAPLQMLLIAIAGWINQDKHLKLEFALEQVRVFRELTEGNRLRLNDDQRRRLAVKGKKLGLSGLRELVTLVTPETIMRWHRELIARKYDGSAKRRPGRPRTSEEVRELIIRMATDNEGWGYTRIVGELWKVGHFISRSTVARILKAHGIQPAPERLAHMPWSKFLRSHWDGLAAGDFFTVEVWTKYGLSRYLVFFILHLSTRRVEVAGIKQVPDGRWMAQIARNLVESVGGFLRAKSQLILDRDPLFTGQFRAVLKSGGVSVVRLPARSPNLNAHAERFVLSIKSECLGRIIPLGERHLRHVIDEYVDHYHFERTHQGLGNRLIDGVPETRAGPVNRLERLGGMLSSYYREAA